jgi:hypothetical protein
VRLYGRTAELGSIDPMSNKAVIISFGLLLVLSSVADFAQRAYFHSLPTSAPRLGAVDNNVLPPAPTATKVFVGTADTLVVASSSNRVYLEIQNISGATTTPQLISCNYGDRPSVLYEGLSIFASTSKVFNLDNLFRGAIRCRANAAGAVVSITDF